MWKKLEDYTKEELIDIVTDIYSSKAEVQKELNDVIARMYQMEK